MQVSSSSAFSSLPVPISRRDELFDRRQAERRHSDAAAEATQPAYERGEITRIRSRPINDTQRATAEVFKFSDQLSGRSRAAMQAYRNNEPSIEERLGVELAGVDVYA